MTLQDLENPTRAGARSRWTRLWITVAVIAALYAGLWWYPHRQLRDGTARAETCFADIEETGQGDPSVCEQSLAVARALPWTSHDAKTELEGEDRRASQIALRLAVVRDLDRGARDRLAERLAQSGHAGDVLAVGAHAALVAHARELSARDAVFAVFAMGAAAALGNVAALRDIAKLAPQDGGSVGVDFAHDRAKLACLFGDAAAFKQAISQLEQAIERPDDGLSPGLSQDHRKFAREEAARLRDLCDPQPAAPDGEDAYRAAWLQLVAGHSPAKPTRGGFGIDADIIWRDSLHAMGDVDPKDYAGEVRAGDLFDDNLRGDRTPWSILFDEDEAPAPDRDDDTAKLVVAFADAAKPEVAHTYRLQGYALSLHAAAGWARRGDLVRAKASVAAATAAAHHSDLAQVEHRLRLGLVPYLHLVGDLDGALAELDAATAQDPHARVGVEPALLFVALNRLDDAWTAIAGASTERAGDFRHNVRWLRAALALRTHRPYGAEIPALPVANVEDPVEYYYPLAIAAPDKQPQLRLFPDGHGRQLGSGHLMLANKAVLPAVLYVAGAGAGGGDIEVWLDMLMARGDFDSSNPVVNAMARAEAARWRGDTAAAKQWDDRVAALRTLVKDDRSAYLLDELTNVAKP